jgi:hypothetical protein
MIGSSMKWLRQGVLRTVLLVERAPDCRVGRWGLRCILLRFVASSSGSAHGERQQQATEQALAARGSKRQAATSNKQQASSLASEPVWLTTASIRAYAQRVRFGCDCASAVARSCRVFFRPDTATCICRQSSPSCALQKATTGRMRRRDRFAINRIAFRSAQPVPCNSSCKSKREPNPKPN